MNWLTESVVYLTRNTIGSLGTYLSAVLFLGFPSQLFRIGSTSLFLLLWCTFLNLFVLMGFFNFLVGMVKSLLCFPKKICPLWGIACTFVMEQEHYCYWNAQQVPLSYACLFVFLFGLMCITCHPVASISRALWKGSSCICISEWHYLPKLILDDCCHANHVRVSDLFMCNLQQWNPPIHPSWSVSGYFCFFEHFCQSFCLTLRDCNNLSCGTETLCGRGQRITPFQREGDHW